ncbi:hypothetical protein [Sinorhizobium medicae]
MHCHRRMNVMSIMRGGDSFRVPPPGTVRSFEDGTTRGERKEDALPPMPEFRKSAHASTCSDT